MSLRVATTAPATARLLLPGRTGYPCQAAIHAA
ncbi:Uncharacterised protein [Micrococcus luteus NCTC 2665]|uniref:Uncharacterized protein n=1 Tax=Micrococcus luteus (strain ATCC 4698 / DSM 20030 / JCM 1464 / CCM 169 / CCUG 5858 / IAM 1056 / NBRC 3333 / NCIMB 9278 / NCTC 2665 / VKM Ac-2230) TaxID=465515 RepID=A0A7Z7KLX2_MICLC|nr:Uncharacterised protein [Micrococcus luteus NCTC 2665]